MSTKALNKVLTSDINGVATWQVPIGAEDLAATLAIGNTTGSTNIVYSAGADLDMTSGGNDITIHNSQ